MSDVVISFDNVSKIYKLYSSTRARLAGIFVNIPDMVNCTAHSIQKRRTAADKVFLVGKIRYICNCNTIMDNLSFVVKQYGGDYGITRFLSLLFQHGVETSDGVLFQPVHGAGAVQDEDQFSQIVSHILVTSFI